MVRSEFNALVADRTPRNANALTDFDSVIGEISEPSTGLGQVRAYADRLDATLASSRKGHAFVNGKHFDMDDVGVSSKAHATYSKNFCFRYF